VLGYSPSVAQERQRIARALGDLPVLTDAFARGELRFSAIRELTRGQLETQRRGEPRADVDAGADVGAKLDETIVRTQARDALVRLGWKPAIARAAVDEASPHVGAAAVEVLIREALRRCPKPRA
jgi:hypothetical protein